MCKGLTFLMFFYFCHLIETYHKAEEERTAEGERKLKKMRDDLLRAEVELMRGDKSPTSGML